MEVVLVNWKIKPELEGDFQDSPFWNSLADETPGFLGEALYRSVEADQGFVRYVRVGRWRRREDFYAALPEIHPGRVPKLEKFEAEPRTREWLAFTLEDTAPSMAVADNT